MIFSTLLFAAAAAPLPSPLTDTHMRDIRCVATLGLVAHEQRRGIATSMRFPNVMQRGRAYAGIVGERVVKEAGQPKEVVALAIKQAVEDVQGQAIEIAEGGGDADVLLSELMTKCLALLDAEVPVEAPTHDDYRFCAVIIGLAADEVEGREGAESVNAKVMRRLAGQLERKHYRATVDQYFPEESAGSAADEAVLGAIAATTVGELDKEKRKQLELAKSGGGLEALSESVGKEKYQRCIFLGE
ncbi:MAG: hypothetical protein V3V15_00850 [Sphingorhabdus sp.]